MPKYYDYMVAGYFLYFTSFCTVECMHVHASDKQMSERGSAKFFVKENGDAVLQNRGKLNDREISQIKKFIKKNYREMFLKWSEYSENLQQIKGELVMVQCELWTDNTEPA